MGRFIVRLIRLPKQEAAPGLERWRGGSKCAGFDSVLSLHVFPLPCLLPRRKRNGSQFNNNQLVTQRRLLMNGMFFEAAKYREIKGFFNTVQSGDEQQVILRGGAVNAEKEN